MVLEIRTVAACGGRDCLKGGTRDLSVVTETYIFIEVLFTWMCVSVKTHGTVHLRCVKSVSVNYT